MNEATLDGSADFLQPLTSIRAGSWIDANFNIWAGHPDDITAWNMLSNVRHLFETKRQSLDKELSDKIYTRILIAEGSDWFWWYGPEHQAPNKPDFDILFRWHIKQIYEMLGEVIPEDVFNPIGSAPKPNFTLPKSQIYFDNDQINWDNAGYYEFRQHFSTMHQSSKPNVIVYFGNDNELLHFQIQNLRENSENNILEIEVGEVKLTVIAEEISGSKVISLPISELNEKPITISLKLINLADNSEFKKKFDYNLL
jgi:alpha-amylase/alpha-mannosidase (GH57 family)